MNLHRVDPHPSVRYVCIGCGCFIQPAGPAYADRDGKAYVDYYCEGCALELDPTVNAPGGAAPDDCPCCHASDMRELGQLGNVMWYRCRRCGMDFHA